MELSRTSVRHSIWVGNDQEIKQRQINLISLRGILIPILTRHGALFSRNGWGRSIKMEREL
jgi:hypothetical protein